VNGSHQQIDYFSKFNSFGCKVRRHTIGQRKHAASPSSYPRKSTWSRGKQQHNQAFAPTRTSSIEASTQQLPRFGLARASHSKATPQQHSCSYFETLHSREKLHWLRTAIPFWFRCQFVTHEIYFPDFGPVHPSTPTEETTAFIREYLQKNTTDFISRRLIPSNWQNLGAGDHALVEDEPQTQQRHKTIDSLLCETEILNEP
jgi:hypothetical protein